MQKKTASKLPRKTGAQKAAAAPGAKGHFGRRPMFKDDAAVVAVLREFSHTQYIGIMSCSLSNMAAELLKKPELFNDVYAPTKTTMLDGRTAYVPHSKQSLKQAVYRLVKANNIWTSRNGG